MWDYYNSLDSIIREEIGAGQKIVIYSLGRVGLLAKKILRERYGYNGIVVDDDLAVYNNEIISLKEYQRVDNSFNTIILCVPNLKQNRIRLSMLKEMKIEAKIRNILDVLIIQCPDKKEYFVQIKQLCQVKEAIGFELVRVGQYWDGGYIMLNDFIGKKFAYSFGIGDDVSWDEWIANRYLDVFCYDYTIGHLPKENNRLHFKRMGISGTDCVDKGLLTLKTILKENGHENEKKMILKMDVEGAEWDIINALSSELICKFSQITLELHNITDIENRDSIVGVLEKLNKTHQPIWIHANNSGGAEQADEIIIPNLLEITYANRDEYSFKPVAYKCPLAIDMPNITHFPDLELIGWGEIR